MFRTFLLLTVISLSSLFVSAQREAVIQEGEFGVGIGAGHYFGDLNTRAHLNRPKIAATAQLGYSDIYNDHNTYMQTRNLSFNSNVWELALQGDFNFFRFMPGEPDYNFTPYVTFGVGVFNYDPFAMLAGQKHYLRPLNTEGQGSSLYPDRKPYGSMAFCIPFGVGVKYCINERINVGFEIIHRVTGTDYLDDVSKTYVNTSLFPPLPDGSPSPAYLLHDRSYELGDPIGLPGRQRGVSTQKDQFATAMFYISFNLQSYKCPTAE